MSPMSLVSVSLGVSIERVFMLDFVYSVGLLKHLGPVLVVLVGPVSCFKLHYF